MKKPERVKEENDKGKTPKNALTRMISLYKKKAEM